MDRVAASTPGRAAAGAIGVLGATGFTGRRVVEALERLAQPYVVIGRRPDALARVAGEHCVDQRIADVGDPSRLVAAFAGLGALVNTVGPFALHGEAVVRAAVEAGVHMTDVSAELAWLAEVGALGKAAELAGVCVLPGNGCDFGFAHLAASLADDAVQGAEAIHVHQWMVDFVPTGGTLDSILRQGRHRPLHLADGQVRRRRGLGIHRKLMQDLDGYGVPWTGAEPVTLSWDLPHVREVTCDLVLSLPEALGFAVGTRLLARAPQRVLDLAGRLASRAPEPAEDVRRRSRFIAVVEAVNGEQIARVRVEAPDIYGITGDLAAVTAVLLSRGEARVAGVHTVGAALDPLAVLRPLASRGVELQLPPEPLRRSA
ncbi:MAG: hypothetical protein EP330_08255 [Deltaproteobacteria bacterium]|nr:MAG: hypothetical protein EP330_08255 [Deltaproteobacteria bacterium]